MFWRRKKKKKDEEIKTEDQAPRTEGEEESADQAEPDPTEPDSPKTDSLETEAAEPDPAEQKATEKEKAEAEQPPEVDSEKTPDDEAAEEPVVEEAPAEDRPEEKPEPAEAEAEDEEEPEADDKDESDQEVEEEPDSEEESKDELDQEPAKETRKGLFARFREKLAKTRSSISGRLSGLISGKSVIDEELLEELEEILITSDVGVDCTLSLLDDLRRQVRKKKLVDPAQLQDAVKESMLKLLDQPHDHQPPEQGPEVILVVGVNGVGKTTTIGKLAHRLRGEGKKVLLAAGDTFRAAAGEQLEIWAERVGADIVRHQAGSDPSAVVFDALEAAKARDVDVVLVDTAGRLHTKVNLMEQLKKMNRVMQKIVPEAPHQTILVLDATTGQNAMAQAKTFHEAAPLTGLIMTKLDGTAKGGIVIAVAHQIEKPVLFVGLGEQMEDLKPFDPEAFVEAIF